MNDLFAEKHVYTVSELTRDIRGILEDSFPGLWVEGEISNVRAPQSGHIYFTLKDENAQLKCVFFRGANAFLSFRLEDGMSAILFGRISVYGRDGQYQLNVQKVEPRGKGALQLRFEQLKKKLAAEGLFDQARKRPLPLLPQRIGIVTSATGAAIRDILHVINRRYANVHIIIRPALVQGEKAAADIAEAIKELNRGADIDVLIVARGGGSLEDLWPFNEEIVARAVSQSPVPVISAVGHEIDFTICDFAADVRAPTPSAAAEMVVKEKEHLVDVLENSARRIRESLQRKLELMEAHFRRLLHSYAMRRPQFAAEQYQQRLDALEKTLQTALVHGVRVRGERIKQLSARLAGLNPLQILSRGYSVTYPAGQTRPLRDAAEVGKNELLKTRLHKGVIISKVEECET